MMQGEYSVSLKDMIEALKLENCTPDVDRIAPLQHTA